MQLRTVLQECLCVAVWGIGLGIGYYDWLLRSQHGPEGTISVVVDRAAHQDPVIACLGAVFMMLVLCLLSRVWSMRLHHATTLAAFFFAMGHVFWSQR